MSNCVQSRNLSCEVTWACVGLLLHGKKEKSNLESVDSSISVKIPSPASCSNMHAYCFMTIEVVYLF